MTANLQQRKIELIQWLSVIDDAELIEKIVDLKDQSTGDWWDEVSQAEKKSIDLGLLDANEGKLNPHTQARSIYEKWL